MVKKRMTILLLAMTLCAALVVASGESTLSARIEGTVLTVNWNGAGPTGTLEIYRNGWPIAVCAVQGASGEKTIETSAHSGRISVKLKTASGCLTADAEIWDSQTAPPATAKPTLVPESTPKPDLNPTPVQNQTVSPTIKPTPVQTIRPSVAPSVSVPASGRGDLASEVIRQVNAERAKNGLSALREDAELTRAACVRANEIVALFSHTRPDGTAWSTVSGRAYGENIAKGQKTADKVMAAWLTSEGHRANILRPGFGSIGVCAILVDGVTYWVQLFGK